MSDNNYPSIRADYVDKISATISEYLNSPGSRVTRFRNQFRRAVANHFLPAFKAGYQESSGGSELGDEELVFLQSAYDREFGFINDNLFVRLRDEIKGNPEKFAAEIANRADGYAKTLDSIYSRGLAMGAGNPLVTLAGSDGKENCKSCANLKGKWLPLRLVIAKGLMVSPGNHNYDCKGYNCEHRWTGKDGKIYTYTA
jgi:hypothetical protein